MKKMMLLLAVAGLSLGAYAQENTSAEIPTHKHKVVTNGFWDNWFIDFGGDFISNYSSQESGRGISANPFSMTRGNFGFDVSVGKWIVPSVGVRLKFIGVDGRQVNSADKSQNPLFSQVGLRLQPILNLHNLFAGYKPRVWNTSLYASMGWARNISGKDDSPVVGAGWLNTFNVTKRFHINVDIFAEVFDNNFDGVAAGYHDVEVGWSLGCGFNLGKVGWDNAPDVDAIMAMNKAQLDALNASLADQQAENSRLQKMIRDHKCPQATAAKVTEVNSSRSSVFFNINKSRIASKKDMVNVKELVEYAKANNKTIVVTGYADSKTGSADYNQKLSERRAQAVADEIVKMGFDKDKIEVVGKGGVKDLSPISYNRRAIVSIK